MYPPLLSTKPIGGNSWSKPTVKLISFPSCFSVPFSPLCSVVFPDCFSVFCSAPCFPPQANSAMASPIHRRIVLIALPAFNILIPLSSPCLRAGNPVFLFFVFCFSFFLLFFLLIFLLLPMFFLVVSYGNVISLYHAKVVVSRIFLFRGKRYLIASRNAFTVQTLKVAQKAPHILSGYPHNKSGIRRYTRGRK